jgi:hypothetical protein
MMGSVVATADSLSQGLALLEDASLIRAGDTGDESEYRFKHSLVQETAYGTLLRERRMAFTMTWPSDASVEPRSGAIPGRIGFHYSAPGT